MNPLPVNGSVPIPSPIGLNFQLDIGKTPDGTSVVVMHMRMGLMQTSVQLNAADAANLGKMMQDVARQAQTGLIIP